MTTNERHTAVNERHCPSQPNSDLLLPHRWTRVVSYSESLGGGGAGVGGGEGRAELVVGEVWMEAGARAEAERPSSTIQRFRPLSAAAAETQSSTTSRLRSDQVVGRVCNGPDGQEAFHEERMMQPYHPLSLSDHTHQPHTTTSPSSRRRKIHAEDANTLFTALLGFRSTIVVVELYSPALWAPGSSGMTLRLSVEDQNGR